MDAPEDPNEMLYKQFLPFNISEWNDKKNCDRYMHMGEMSERCSKFSPLLAMHALYRRTMDWRAGSHTPGFCWISAETQTIIAAEPGNRVK
ncbi:hypothetical protein TNCT_494161 [Trichonephila clavata]|uniref:Uncharacterized protein n=1 Tax=Trichonephila clavata TaxID=2740835 RepID=A0A8X6KU17_TRICU|nr:hypothetical protein TNCT_494161 [Trichonephila clavata]